MNLQESRAIAEQSRRAYDALADSYAKEWAAAPDLALADEFLSRLPPGGMILDVGCGPGHYGRYFLDRGFAVNAIDTSGAMLQLARDRGVRARNMDMARLSYPDDAFDGLWVCASLPHIPRECVNAVLEGFRRVLRQGGVMLVNVIIGEQDHRIETVEEMGPGYGAPGRFFQWYPEPEAFREILEKAGFEILDDGLRSVTSHVLERATWHTNCWYNCFVAKPSPGFHITADWDQVSLDVREDPA